MNYHDRHQDERRASPGWQFLVAAFAVSLGLYVLGAVLRVVEGL